MSNIVVTGSLAIDKICQFDGLFSEHIFPEKMDMLSVIFTLKNSMLEFGGTAGNIAYNLGLLGENPVLVSNVGEHFDIYKNHLEKVGVNLQCVKVYPEEQTAECVIVNDNNKNQIGTFYEGVLRHEVGFNRVADLKEGIRCGIVSPTYKKSMINAADFFKKKKIPFIFDPGQQIGNFDEKEFLFCLENAYVLITNEYEWQMIRRHFNISKEYILENCKNLVVTLGKDGAVIYSSNGNEDFIESVKTDNVVETTGAGDGFRAGILYGMKHDLGLKKGCEIGAKISSIVVQQTGTQKHFFDLNTILN